MLREPGDKKILDLQDCLPVALRIDSATASSSGPPAVTDRLGGCRFHPTLVHTFPAFEDATAASMKRMPAKPSRTVG
jgi:hypothetical protein